MRKKLPSLYKVLFMAVILLSGCDLSATVDSGLLDWSHEDTEPPTKLDIRGVTVRDENDLPLQHVKVILIGEYAGIHSSRKQVMVETVTDEYGRFRILESVRCRDWTYEIDAWLSVISEGESPRLIENLMPVDCKPDLQEIELRLRKVN